MRRKEDDEILVWKELDYGSMNEKEKKQLVAEVNILKDISSPHVVKYCDRLIDIEKQKLYIVMEYCKGGDLSKLIKAFKQKKKIIPEE